MEEKQVNENIVNPLKRLKWSEKKKDDYKWFRDCTDYFINNSNMQGLNKSLVFDSDTISETKDYWYNLLRELYHNDISVSLYKSFTKTKFDSKKSSSVAKVRDLNMIKPNIDFIGSNFRKRKFNWSVSNTDNNSYNEFQTQFKEDLLKRLNQRFVQLMNNEDGSQKQVDLSPDNLKAQFALSYKDNIAVDYQQYLTNVLNQERIHEKSSDIFLDYLIYGQPISFTSINNDGRLEYRRVDTRFFRYNKSNTEKYIKFSEWQVEVELITVADAVNRYYKEIDADKYLDMIGSSNQSGRFSSFYNNINSSMFTDETQNIHNKIPVYHVYWQGRKMIKKITYYENGVLTQKEVTEEYKIDKELETEEVYWKNCIYKTDRIGKNYYEIGEYLYDCSDISDSGKCIMPYNGFTFGHYYDDKVYSVLKLGIPYLTSFLICHYLIDKLLVKHKGKIFILDWNAIPNKNGWNLEKFLKYSDELGYAFIDRSNDGVDKNYNQYTSIDMGTLGSVFELINLSKTYQELWDTMISVPRQLRGQTFASDEVGTTQSAVTQSGITIDYIYQKFDDFMSSDMETIMELGKYIIIDNNHSNIFYSDDGIKQLNLQPEQIIASKLRLIAVNNSQENSQLEDLKNYAKINNQQDPLIITEFITANSLSQLKQALTKIRTSLQEEKEQEANQQQQRQIELDNLQKEIKQFELGLEKQLDDYKTDNKIRFANETLVPSLQTDTDRDGIPDILEIQNKFAIENRKIDVKNKEIDVNQDIEMKKLAQDKQNSKVKK